MGGDWGVLHTGGNGIDWSRIKGVTFLFYGEKNGYKMGQIGDILQSRGGLDTNEMRWNKKKVRMILEYVQKNR